MQLAPNSQEPQAPEVPAGPGPARTRHQTRRSRTVEEVAQKEILPTGDEAELREVRQVQEVVKTVAVVRGRGGGVVSGSVPRVEEVSEGAEEGEGGPRRRGRRGTTTARLEEELDEVMARRTGRRRSGASPGAVVREEHTVEVTEGEAGANEEEEVSEEPEEGEGLGKMFFTPQEEEEEEMEDIEISEDEEVDDQGMLGGGGGGGGEEMEEEEEEEAATEVESGPETENEHEEEEEEEEEGGGPRIPGKLLRGALAAGMDTLRGVLGGHHEHEHEEEPAPTPRTTPRRSAAKPQQQQQPAPTPRAVPRRAAAKLKPAPAAAAAKKGGKMGAKKGRGRGKKRQAETYKRYVYAVLKQVHPDLGISSKAMEVMHAFMVDAFERLASAAGEVTTKVARRRTLGARDVQTAARLVLPGTLAEHAVQEGKRAVLRFEKAG